MQTLALVLVLASLFAMGSGQVEAPLGSGEVPAVLVGAGDIASCSSDGDEATARLLDEIPGTVFTAGDNAYERGTDREFADCYHPTWGRHRSRTRPAAGNHDYGTGGALGYFRYFGSAAGPQGRGYYSFTVGTWRVIVLNSVCWAVGDCGPESPQAQWLRAELAPAAQSTTCVAAIMHHPPFSSGRHGPTFELRALWQILYEAGAELVLAGHDHLYERFAPQDPHGRLDLTRGIRQITVGTGGRSHYAFRGVAQNSEVRSTGTFGVLKLSLTSTAYAWQFVPVRGKTFTDSGTTRCH